MTIPPKILITELERYPADSLHTLETGIGTVLQSSLEDARAAKLCSGIEVLIVGLQPTLYAEVLAEFPRLKVIATATTGEDHIDLAEARRRGIRVVSLRGEAEFLASVTSTAEFTWGLLLSVIRKIPNNLRDVLEGRWERENEAYGFELQGKTLGILGIGRIGTWVARYGQGFGMQVIAHDPELSDAQIRSRGAEPVQRDELFRRAQVLSVHASLTDRSKGSVGAREFSLLPRGAVFLNTARSGIVDESAMLQALDSGTLSAAAIDVLNGETSFLAGRIHLGHPTWEYAKTHPRLLVTSHIAGQARDAIEKTRRFTADKVVRAYREA